MRQRWLIRIFLILLVLSAVNYWYYWSRHHRVTTEKHPSIEEWVAKNKDLLDKNGATYVGSDRKVHTYAAKVSPTPTPSVTPTPEAPHKVALLPLKNEAIPLKKDERVPKIIFADIITSKGIISIHLWVDKAPNTVKNFIRLSEDPTMRADNKPYYDGLQVFRTVPDYFIQTGDPSNTGTKGLGFFEKNEFNTRSIDITAGMVVMAKAGESTSKSQFFIALRDMEKLIQGSNTVFGEVVNGLQIVREISRAKADIYDHPLTPIVIQEIKIRRIYEEKGIVSVKAKK